jgi:hypothetical protein
LSDKTQISLAFCFGEVVQYWKRPMSLSEAAVVKKPIIREDGVVPRLTVALKLRRLEFVSPSLVVTP